ncbi:centromere protein C [Sporothrix schenckii 1099-18]|uniref:CENP-C homolog n=1 Tax=Sporothrix schenckii 1099-18 TaxID=1397361 RepID=A0A0F2M6V8_SPOSC|nr:centromere protein C [Sporothrix schenckii 1099-18]KJR85377.1 centromere protein C [Sporothrix schenckii 1099-18]
MAPPRGGGRRSTQTSEHIYKLGERGRKTGVTLRDTGVRDEHGMEPIDDIFSSPAKGNSDNGDEEEEDDEEEGEEADEDDDDDENGEAPMDLTTGSGLDPAAMINGQGAFGARRSPAKTLFGSPAVRGSASKKTAAIRQNPLLRPPSSPSANTIHQTSSPSKPVKRRLDYGKNTAATAQRRPFTLAPPTGANARRQHLLEEDEEDNDEESNVLQGGHIDEDSMQIVGGPDSYDENVDAEPLEEELPARPAAQVKRRAGRPPGKGKSPATNSPAASKKLPPGPQQIPSSVPKKRGRPAAAAPDPTTQDTEDGAQNAKRRRLAAGAEEDPPKPKGRPRGRPAAAVAKRAPADEETQPEEQPDEPADDAAPKKRGRKRKSSGVGAATAAAAAVPRGPPLPKSRGLVVRRREIADGSGDLVKTRSGRSSFRPLAFWRNEHVEFDPNDVQQDGFGRRTNNSKFLLPTIKDIVRVDEEVLPRSYGPGGSRRGGGAGGAKRGRKRRPTGDGDGGDNEPDRDAWEANPGKVSGDIVVWYPEHELDPPALGQNVEMTSAEIALSDAAIQTHEVRGGTFRFVKTLSLPFFGTGMVDMPPGSEKKLKNSRKMHMTFFVHYGHVLVKVNESEFRIAKGGMWSVPRGNYYSITNDKDYPARVFFAQGCEILAPVELDEDDRGNQ